MFRQAEVDIRAVVARSADANDLIEAKDAELAELRRAVDTSVAAAAMVKAMPS